MQWPPKYSHNMGSVVPIPLRCIAMVCVLLPTTKKANTTQLGRSLAMCQNLTPVKFKSCVNNPQLTVLKHNSCFALFS